jgi:dihydroxyacetone kinase-like predicted kinase
MEAALQAGQDSVKRGPDMLPILREAGVVDAGGYALTVLFAGIVGALRGSEPPPLEHHEAARITQPQHASATFRYCTNFAVTGQALDRGTFIRALERLGDSVLVVGDRTTLKIHVHTDDPNAATGLFDGTGTISHLDVADMHEQVRERQARLAETGARVRCGVLAVITGDGIQTLFESLGARVLDGGPTLNPSTYDLLAAIHAVAADEIVVLPNSSNVIMAAERAAELSERTVHVVPSRSQQAGLAAAVSLDPDRGAAENAEAMQAALARVRTGAIAPAARDDARGRFHTGDAVGFVDDRMIAWGETSATLRAVIEGLAVDAELLTVITGEEPPLQDEAVTALVDGSIELELSHGGQRSYWWLLAAE